MSSGGQIVGGIVGAVVGFFVTWNPYGALQGAAIGASIGGYLDPPKGPTQEGPRLTDKSVQTSTYGATIPRVYGTCMVAGNVFWLQGDQLTERVRKESSGGKGGGGSSSTLKTYTYYATFAIGMCKGPIAGVRRIWVGPDLIYDAGAEDVESVIRSNQNIENIQVYLGTEDQLPNSLMQADKGAANVPAYRGLAYLVFRDFELTKYGNSLAQAQVKVEIVRDQNVNYITVDSFNFNASGTLFPLGGAGDDGAIRIQYTESGIIKNLTRTSGGQTSFSSVFDSNQYSSVNLHRTSTPETKAYTYADNDLTGGDYITIISDKAFWSDTSSGYFVTSYARDGNSVIGVASGGLVYSSENEFENAVVIGYGSVKKLLFTSSLPTGSLSGVGLLAGNLAIAMSSSGNFNIYSVDISGSDIEFNLAGSVPTAPKYGFNNIGFWRMTFGAQYLLTQYDSDLNEIFTYPIDEFSFDHGYSFNNYIVACLSPSSTDEHRSYAFKRTENTVLLSSIVQSETLLSQIIESGDIIVNDLSDSVFGYRIASAGSIRNSIEPLRGAWPFDVIQDGYKIRYKPRGTQSVASIDIGELGIEQQIQETREMDSQLPRKVIIKHIDRSRDYDANEQSAQRENVDSVNTLNMDLPVVLTGTEAKRVAEKLLYIYWLERSDFSFVLPPTYMYLQPSDVITIVAPYASYDIRISNIKYAQNGNLECVGKPNNASVYNSIADSDGGLNPPVTIPLPGPSIAALIDAPIIDETLQNEPGFSAQMSGLTTGWPAGNLFVTSDLGQSWTTLQSFSGKGTFGVVSGALSQNSGNLIQTGGSITVSLFSGELESITEAQMLNGRNYAAYGVDGRWEIIRFQNATLNSDGSYTLDTFIRGDRGTEWATALHQFGDTFILMDDPDGAWISQASSSIGVERGYRAVTAGYSIDSSSTANFTYRGVNLETYSPTHGSGSRDGSGNLIVNWIRRTRVGGEWRSLVDASLGETIEAYEVDVINGSTVVRTISTTTQSASYTADQQTTDFGSPQASVTVRIYQLSSVVGRGQPLEVTV